MGIEYKKGDRVIITECDAFCKEEYQYDKGFTGIINEDKDTGYDIPFILFDNKTSNYTSMGTAVSIYEFKIVK